jgi:hypothetical protein
MQWLIQKLSERFVALFGRMFAFRFETMVVLQEMADQELIEQQAKQYEADGLTLLAEQLRARAKSVSADNPASLALPVIRNIAQDDFADLPAALPTNAEDSETATAANTSSTSRRLAPKSGT